MSQALPPQLWINPWPDVTKNSFLNAQALQPIATLVNETAELMLLRYPLEEYEPRTYVHLKERFSNLMEVEDKDIHDALNWKDGYLRQPVDTYWVKRAVQWFAGNRHHAASCRSWVILLRALNVELPFNTAGFITHLACPDQVPMADPQSFRAMRYLLGRCGMPAPMRDMPEIIPHLQQMQTFLYAMADAFTPLMPDAQIANRYLRMFGTHVAPPPGIPLAT